jgi:predicted permease
MHPASAGTVTVCRPGRQRAIGLYASLHLLRRDGYRYLEVPENLRKIHTAKILVDFFGHRLRKSSRCSKIAGMAGLISIFVSDILPIFLIAGAGFVVARRFKADVKTLSAVVFYALIPCFVFRLLVTSKITGTQLGTMALLAVLVTGMMALLGRIVASRLRLSRPELSAFLLVVMFSNGGNYGLPVVLFALGTEALAHGTVYFVTCSILTYTVGVFLASAGHRSAAQAIAGIRRVPAIYGVVAALVVVASGVSVPVAFMRPIGLLSDAALPLMILVLGMQLERATMPERPSMVFAAAGLSLLGAPIVALGLAWLLGLSGPALQAGVLLAAMPTAVITTILALQFNLSSAFVTSAVFVSTLLSPLTLTPLIAYLKMGS